MLWAEEKVFSLYKTFQQTAKSSSACLKSLEKSDLKVSSCGVVMMEREKEGCFFPWWTVQKDSKGAFLRGQKMLHAKKKVSSNSRKAVIKAGTFLPQRSGEKGAEFSSRERSTVMNVIRRSGVLNPPKHSLCARVWVQRKRVILNTEVEERKKSSLLAHNCQAFIAGKEFLSWIVADNAEFEEWRGSGRKIKLPLNCGLLRVPWEWGDFRDW